MLALHRRAVHRVRSTLVHGAKRSEALVHGRGPGCMIRVIMGDSERDNQEVTAFGV